MKVGIGSDHRGCRTKQQVLSFLENRGVTTEDLSQSHTDASDYPDVAAAVAQGVARRQYEFGVLICGTGIGMSIAANKVNGVRAALVHDQVQSRMARSHNDANVICLSGEQISGQSAEALVALFLDTPFEGGRHQRRLDKIAALEKQGCA